MRPGGSSLPIDRRAPVPEEKKAHLWERDPDEWYVEEVSAVEFLLQRESFRGTVYDPCCGLGTIPTTFLKHGIEAFGTDLRTRRPGAEWFRGELDFMLDYETPLPAANNVVMNPPFFRAKGLEAFLRRALSLPVYKVAAFVPASFLWGADRATSLFEKLPPTRAYPIYPRPSCPPGAYLEAGGKPKGGTSDFAWLVWDLGTIGGTTRFIWRRPGRPY
jgi:hypothetical protein